MEDCKSSPTPIVLWFGGYFYFLYTGELCKPKYIKDVLKKFNMEDCKSSPTPIEQRLTLEPNKESTANLPYRNLIGSLMYLAVATRPDIMFAVTYLSQFNNCYNGEHYKCAKRVLRYLKGTMTTGLMYERTGGDLNGMADADWGACKIDRKSYSGYCFKYSTSCISWASRKQRCVALATCEAEYVALTEAAKEAIHLKLLLNNLGVQQETVRILSDNQAALKLSQNPMITSKSKHIALKEHFIKDCVMRGDIQVDYLETHEMEADLFTKGVPGPRLIYLRELLGLK